MVKPRRPVQPEIRIDEARVARGSIDHRSLRVTIEPELGAVQGSPVIAALADLPDPVDVEILRSEEGTISLVPKRWQRLSFGGGRTLFEAAGENPEEVVVPIRVAAATEYATRLLRQYLPGFDSLSPDEQTQLLSTTIARINIVSKALDALEKHLEYAEPYRRAVPPFKDPRTAVHATLLGDVHEFSTIRIGEELGISSPKDAQIKGENQTVRAMIRDRGRPLLEQFFGSKDWRAKVKRMQAERMRWKEMEDQPKRYCYALLAEARGSSAQEEEHAAFIDGFDDILEQFLDAWVREEWGRRYSIMQVDPRFEDILRRL